jgi:phospholipase C
MPSTTRRRLLGTTAAAGAATLLPTSVQQAIAASAANPRPGKLSDIKHVVLLMQENRSFDHYFGTLSGVAGFDDPEAIKLSTGRSVFHQPDAVNPDGYTLPFHLDTNTTSGQSIPSTSHAWNVQHQALNGGLNNNWLPAHRAADGANGPYTMSYYTRADIPFHYALADAFTVCDHYHCSMLGPTWPNRMYWMTGTCDPNGLNGGPILDNSAPEGGYTWTTYAERLTAAGVSWKVYQQSDVDGKNMLNEFAQFQNASPDSTLYTSGQEFQPVGAFEYDARNDNLPTVSWILPSDVDSEHPNDTPAYGAAYIASKIDAIAANPEVWAKTVFILSYDENDGLFDHVVPPIPPAGTADEFVSLTSSDGTAGDGLPVGGGFRVPCIIISPWTAGGFVASEKFDHTSQLQFLEQVTGVAEPNISDWRRRTFGDLTSAFRFHSNAEAPVLPDTHGELITSEYEVSVLPAPTLPGADQSMPTQEPGRRPKV